MYKNTWMESSGAFVTCKHLALTWHTQQLVRLLLKPSEEKCKKTKKKKQSRQTNQRKPAENFSDNTSRLVCSLVASVDIKQPVDGRIITIILVPSYLCNQNPQSINIFHGDTFPFSYGWCFHCKSAMMDRWHEDLYLPVHSISHHMGVQAPVLFSPPGWCYRYQYLYIYQLLLRLSMRAAEFSRAVRNLTYFAVL